MIKSIVASVLLFSAVALPVSATESQASGKDQLTNEASGICWPGRLRCSSEGNPRF